MNITWWTPSHSYFPHSLSHLLMIIDSNCISFDCYQKHVPTIYQPSINHLSIDQPFINHVPTTSQPPKKKQRPVPLPTAPVAEVKLWSKQPSAVFEHMTFDGFMVLLWCFYGGFNYG